jgi:hypothetical protein
VLLFVQHALQSSKFIFRQVTVASIVGAPYLDLIRRIPSSPVSFDQSVQAFSILWCMTLKCRMAVLADNPLRPVRPSYQRPIAMPSTSRTNNRPSCDWSARLDLCQ